MPPIQALALGVSMPGCRDFVVPGSDPAGQEVCGDRRPTSPSLSLCPAAALKPGRQTRQPAPVRGAVLHDAFLVPAPVGGLRVFAVLGQHPFQAGL